MKKAKLTHRLIASFFIAIILPSVLPTNLLYASNGGPKSPEAASFEPVDATDMVNLLTGQYSYVLPLLNVPSPEGGYPLALSYHAGIAMDQQASWTGLGWNVNPGVINRNVNGYPDDYNSSNLNEFFFDSGDTETAYSVSLGYMSLTGASVGVGFNWGSHQALGGYVSAGYGIPMGKGTLGVSASAGTNGASASVGIKTASGLTLGVNASTNGNVGASIGYTNTNGEGFSIGANTNGSVSLGLDVGVGNDNIAGLDVTLSSSGVGISGGVTNKTGKNIDGGIGSGMFLSFNNTINSGDYATDSSSWMVVLFVPTHVGFFSASFGKQEFKYWMGKNVDNFISGPIYFSSEIRDVTKLVPVKRCTPAGQHGLDCSIIGYNTVLISRGFMDVNELSFSDSNFLNNTDVSANNMTFPNYDNFVVNGQGVSGSMSATHYKSGALFGLDGKLNKEGYSLKYAVNNSNSSINDYTKFNSRPQFQFDNEITSYLEVDPALFNNSTNLTNILDYYILGSTDVNDKERRKTSSFIEYFTNDEIVTNLATLKGRGYLETDIANFNRSNLPKDGIGAFKVTSVDGKTYHYSLPVYNHEIITRTNGVIADRPAEAQSYFEKRQLEPFATHWLLTAVTGPDYVDNGDGIANQEDLGYWINFEYGKWTDAFIWKNPYKKDKFIDDDNPTIQTWIRGRKELYYLDRVKTRTHTALFVKSERLDSPSPQWNYDSADHNSRENNSVVNRFIVPSQKQLRLDKIILLKNENDVVDKKYGSDNNSSLNIFYNGETENLKEDLAFYNMKDAVLDVDDNWQNTLSNAVKVIDFNYDYSLVQGDERLTLKSVNFKGKSDAQVLPPYQFDYYNNSNSDPFDINEADGWGYHESRPYNWSLKEIITPQGSKIKMNYEINQFKSATSHSLEFSDLKPTKFNSTLPNHLATSDADLTGRKVILNVGNDFNYSISLGQKVDVNYFHKFLVNQDPLVVSGQIFYDIYERTYVGKGTITALPNSLGGGKYEVTFDANPSKVFIKTVDNYDIEIFSSGYQVFMEYNNITSKISVGINIGNNNIFEGGGIRVKNIQISDGINKYNTEYKYGSNDDGVGYVSYVPYAPHIVKEVPFSSELPAPRVMYEYVTMSSYKEGVSPEFKLRYKFNVMKEKSPDKVKYGDFYEIDKTSTPTFTNSINKDVSINQFTIKENFAALGQLLEVSSYNAKGHLISKMLNNYVNKNEIPNNIGITQESYQSYKEVDYTNNTNVRDKWAINSSTRIKYPSILKSSTEHKNGYSYTTQFLDYDLVSGVSKTQLHTSSDGRAFKTQIVPAYTKYPGMGSKVDDINNANMLSQVAAQYSYLLDNGAWKITGVGITTWNNHWTYKTIEGDEFTPSNAKEKVWRKHKTYVWDGVTDSEGIFQNYDTNTDDEFDWVLGVGGGATSKWKKISEITLYNNYSAPLEVMDINGNKATTKMGDGDTKIAAVGNAGYNELFYTGAEYIKYIDANNSYLDSEIKLDGGNTNRDETYVHTGKFSFKTTSTNKLSLVLKSEALKNYKLSVWVHKTNADKARVNGDPFNGESYTAGNWVLKTHYLENVPKFIQGVSQSAFNVNISSADNTPVYYDDFMLRPVASSITGYVYNEYDELTHIIGNNGLATRYEYDAAGRLVKTYAEIIDDPANGITTGGFKLKTTHKINYKNAN